MSPTGEEGGMKRLVNITIMFQPMEIEVPDDSTENSDAVREAALAALEPDGLDVVFVEDGDMEEWRAV